MVAKKNNQHDILRRVRNYASVDNSQFILQYREKMERHIERHEVELVELSVAAERLSSFIGYYSILLLASLEYE